MPLADLVLEYIENRQDWNKADKVKTLGQVFGEEAAQEWRQHGSIKDKFFIGVENKITLFVKKEPLFGENVVPRQIKTTPVGVRAITGALYNMAFKVVGLCQEANRQGSTGKIEQIK